mmetsp:Transcript_15401/g.35710  ORF Transcript_15401/g.35710 Transcript_15401/m.35710 type:complete len:1270 (-) Transcript_15401:110-3919(-)
MEEEEEGTEILFRPGMENILTDHFMLRDQTVKSEKVNLIEYCTTEAIEESDMNRKAPTNLTQMSDEGDGKASDGEDQYEPTFERAFFPAATQEQTSHLVVNRFDSLVQNATTDEDDQFDSDDQVDTSKRNDNGNYAAHEVAVYNEGQEAVWHEDEYSTISSIYVKPEKYVPSVTAEQVLPARSQHSRKKIKVPFFTSRGKKAKKQLLPPDDREPTHRPVKIHIKKKKIAKSVLLLPPVAVAKPNEERISEENDIGEEKERYASITENSIQARHLLDTVLSQDDLDEEDLERIAKEAFSHATAARHLARGHDMCNEMNINTTDANVAVDEAIELENVLSYLAEEGERAALEHRKHCNLEEDVDNECNKSANAQADTKLANSIDVAMIEPGKSLKSKKKTRGKFPVSCYASRAVHYLESILPKSNGNEKAEEIENEQDDASNAIDFWSDAGISTLGLKNDTLEYGLNTDDGGDGTDGNHGHEGAPLVRNDMISLSSLNEILDGGVTINGGENQLGNDNLNEGTRCQRLSTREPSPRAAVQEIGIPRKKKNTGLPPTHPRPNRTRILGLVTPKIVSCNHGNKKGQNIATDNNSGKKWGGFFRTPRANDAIPNQLNLVIEENEEINPEVKHNEFTSQNSAENKENDFQSDLLVTEKLVKIDSDSNLGIPQDNRYTPAFVDEEIGDKGGTANRYRPIIPRDNEIELKLSIGSIDEGKNSDNGGLCNDDANVIMQVEEETKRCDIYKEVTNDLKIPDDEKSDDDESRDRYQTEPVGKTPRRDGLNMEKNTDRKFKAGKKEIQKESLSTNFDEAAAKEVSEEEEQLNKKKIPNQTDLDKKVIGQKTDIIKGRACGPIENSNPSRKILIHKAKMVDVEKCEETDVGRNKTAVDTNIENATKTEKTNSLLESQGQIPKTKDEEMSAAQSEGSKTKIFGRVADLIGRNKRKPLVPIAIVEEKYVAGKDMTNLTGVHHIHNSKNSFNTNKIPKRTEKVPLRPIVALKPTTGQRAKEISQMADDSTVMVQKAIVNGNLKAVESNEEGDDVVPLNYLSMMLRRKLQEGKVCNNLKNDITTETGDSNQQQQHSFGEKVDADSFVAMIRGQRQKEAPGVALEEIAIRNYQNNRDPFIGNGTSEVRIDLAPTPRRPEGKLSVFNDDDETISKARDPPIKEEEDERQRRKMITERLFQAGGSNFQDETMTNKKEDSENAIKTAPTVESEESYCGGEPANEHEDSIVESDATSKISENIDHNTPYLHSKVGRGRRILSIIRGSSKRK